MRDPAITQLKGFLIFLVVFGHIIEGFSPSIGRDWLYNFIYSFHMPAFVAVSGFLFKPNPAPAKLVKTILLPFLVYNIIFELSSFSSFGRFTHSFYQGAPYWHLWFLLALFIWKIMTPALLSFRWPLLASVALALLFPTFNADGYLFSLGRIIHFFPFFLIGFIFKDKLSMGLKSNLTISSVAIIALCFIPLFFAFLVPTKILYGSYTYFQVPLPKLEGLGYTAASLALGTVGLVFSFY